MKKNAAAGPGEGPCFEDELAKVKGIIERMESGELGLEDSLLAFESGIAGLRRCRKILSDVETRVKILADDEELPFDAERTGAEDLK